MQDNIPEAIVVKKSRFSIVWLIPFLALALGGWLTFKYLYEKGPVIKIEFGSAYGLAAGKTKIKYKEVEVGVVDDISFGKDLENVIVTASLDKDMRPYLNEKTQFWIVKAEVAAGKVSGLNTLLSGAYIGMQPGDGQTKQRTFKALDKPPILHSRGKGTLYKLQSKTLHSFDTGAPVYYKRLKVGQVIEYHLDPTGSKFDIEVFINAPYDKLVHNKTLFWNASGVNVKMTAEGIDVQAPSLVSILLGGVAFDNLDDSQRSPRAAPGSVFQLYKNRSAAMTIDYKKSQTYRLYFGESAGGLKVGAPVTLRGITIGSVTDVRLEYDLNDKTFKIPVEVEFEPERLAITGRSNENEPLPTIEDLVDNGLRAQLRTGNLLTGQQIIEFDIYPDAPPAVVGVEDGMKILPTIPTSIAAIKQGLIGVLEKINNMPLEDIGINLNGVLEGVNKLVNSNDARDMLSNINAATRQLNATLARTEGVAAGLSQDSDAYQELIRTMRELSGAARSLRQMADYLERHPEALLKGKPK